MLKYALIAGLLMTQVPLVQTADAAVSASDLKKLAKTGKSKFCRKASFWEGIVSVRSFEGALCLNKGVAAIAMKLCKKTPGFMESGCAINARRVLGGQNEDTVIQQEKAADPTIEEIATSVGE